MREGRIEVKGRIINYKIIKRSKKNIILRMGEKNQVEVSIPKGAPYRIGEGFIMKNFDKIYSNLQERIKTAEKNKKKKSIKILGRDVAKGNFESVEAQLMESAKIVFKEILDEWIPKVGAAPKSIRIKKIKSAWGICYSNKNITLNLKLIQMEKSIIEYIIVHELCHLHHMNHSKKFWDLVESFLPAFKEERRKLKILEKDKNYFY